MAGLSQTMENALLNWMKGTTFTAAPATTYVALFTTAPTNDANAGSTEVSGNAYARVAVTSSTGWSAISGAPSAPAQISNSGTISFPTPTPSGWGTVLAFGIFDASSAGNLLWWNTMTSVVVSAGQAPSFAVGQLILTAD